MNIRFLRIFSVSIFLLFVLVYTGNNIQASGGFGNAVKILNRSSMVTVPALLPDDTFTFEAWVKADDFTSNTTENRYLYSQVSNYNRGSYTEATFSIEGNRRFYNGKVAKVRVSFYDGSGQPVAISLGSNVPVLFSTGIWHHVAVVKDLPSAKLFVDGTMIGSVQNPGGNNFVDPKSLSIGAYADRDPGDSGFAAYQSWKGEIEEVRISSIKRYLNTFTPRQIPFNSDSDTIGLYHLDSGYYDYGPLQLSGQSVGTGVTLVPSTVLQISITP